MNVRQLEVLRTMIRTGSVSETARRLGISQPAASKILGAIELDLGMTLFSRANGRLHTTREAQDLFPEIERIFGDMATFRQRAAELREGRAGEVRIASAPVLGTLLLPQAIQRFGAENPGVRFDAQVLPTPEIIEQVRANRVDLALAQAVPDDTLTIIARLCVGRVVCVLPPGHRLCGHATVTPADLAGERLITFYPGAPTGDRIREAFRNAGQVLETVVDTNQAFFAASLVRNGVGVALIDSPFPFAEYLPELVVVPLEPEIRFILNALASRLRPLTPVALRFARTLATVAAEIAGNHPGMLPLQGP
ncbi:LysR family transcriptional regulator [Stella humosa]|uniref:LysR family transcriptional regulator n=1 Tax=Stella humosa TaxID=94 RepID=A0A3N1M993_9PROT|nr:LysR family transcriptional regulator [Stella humosa]ROQ00253.1 LysR family transcriptional regulator [Stella humosa]BBK30510.1 LysR family transcriptional regulator [Stella humosa]